MVTLLGPILAQLVTLSAGARAEGRVISVDTTHYYEAAGRPVVALELLEQRFRLQAVYSPSFTLTPLDSNPQLLVFHSGGIGASYAWRRTVLSVGEFIGYGEQNFRVLATAGNTLSTNPNQMPTGTGTTGTGTTGTGTTGTGTTGTGTTGTGTTGTGTTGTGTGTPTGTGTTPVGTGIGAMGGGINSGTAQPPTQHVLDENIRFITSTTSAGLGYQLSASSSLGFGLAYIVAGALDAKSKADYPTVHGPVASANVNDRVDRANGLGASVSYQYSVASNGNVASLVGTNGNWTHDFNARSSSQLGLGVSGGRNSRTDGYVAYSIYPTFVAGVTNVTRLSPGSLSHCLWQPRQPPRSTPLRSR